MSNLSIWYHLTSTNKCIKRYFIKHLPKSFPNKVSPIQMAIIDYLDLNGNIMYQKDICREFNIRRSTASGIIKTMEKNNIVVSRMIGRNKEIKLSDTFIKKYANKYPDIKKLEKLMENNFTEEEKAELIRLLEKVENNLKEE